MQTRSGQVLVRRVFCVNVVAFFSPLWCVRNVAVFGGVMDRVAAIHCATLNTLLQLTT
eukprot:COSAG06_NODE_1798_length_8368_cov_4.946668_3_plen_58_part_00